MGRGPFPRWPSCDECAARPWAPDDGWERQIPNQCGSPMATHAGARSEPAFRTTSPPFLPMQAWAWLEASSPPIGATWSAGSAGLPPTGGQPRLDRCGSHPAEMTTTPVPVEAGVQPARPDIPSAPEVLPGQSRVRTSPVALVRRSGDVQPAPRHHVVAPTPGGRSGDHGEPHHRWLRGLWFDQPTSSAGRSSKDATEQQCYLRASIRRGRWRARGPSRTRT